MAENSKIEWTDHTFNPWWGCTKVSPGCKNCYAETQSNRFGNWWGKDAERRFFGDKHWSKPRAWNRKAEKLGVRHKVFCGSMCDVFEIYSGREAINTQMHHERAGLFGLIESTPHLIWLLLTKRPENVIELTWPWRNKKWPDNVWIGTSVENQEEANLRIPELLKIPAKVRFLSCEPLLGYVELGDALYPDFASDDPRHLPKGNGIDWVIVGGESGSRKRPFNPDWARSLRDECKLAGVPFFMKQIDKVQPIPDDLMIREFPND